MLNVTSYGYDQAGRVKQTTVAPVGVNAGAVGAVPLILDAYDAWGNPTHHQDAHGRVTVTVRDDMNRVSTITHPAYQQPGGALLTPVEVFNYDPNGNLVTQTTRRGYTIDHTYDDLNQVLTTTNERNNTTSYMHDAAGNLKKVTTATGAVTNYAYNDYNLVETESLVVRPVTLANAGGTVAGGTYTTTYRYDDLGYLESTTTPAQASTNFVHDPFGNLRTMAVAGNPATTWTYDHLHQVVQTTDPEGRRWVNNYDPLGRLQSTHQLMTGGAPARGVDYLYYASGRVHQVTDDEGREEQFWYDAHNRVEQVRVRYGNGTQEFVDTFYGYNYNGALTYQQDGNANVTTHTVNAWDLNETTVHPVTPDHIAVSNRTFTTVYDAGGNVIETRDPNYSVANIRDEIGQITPQDASNTGYDRLFVYDADNRLEYLHAPWGYSDTYTYTYDDRSLLVESDNAQGTTSYSYDGDGRLVSRTEAFAGTATVTHGFTWTAQNELLTHTDPVSATTGTYVWNDASQVDTITYSADGSVRDFGYNQFGDVQTDVMKTAGNTVRHSSTYTYDDRGDIDTLTRVAQGQTTLTHDYGYDRAGRLVTWHATGTGVNDLTSYSYDDAGNRLTKTTNSVVDTWTYDQRNRILSAPGAIVYRYRANGMLYSTTNNGVATIYTYSAFGQLRAQYTGTDPTLYHYYDAAGRLIHRIDDDNADIRHLYAYDGASHAMIRNKNQTTASITTYGRTPGGRLASLQDDIGNRRIAGLNRHGDLEWLYNNTTTHNTTETITYTPYGEIYDQWGTDPDPELGYQTQYTDPTTGDVLMQARWYSPGSGTFRSRDTWAGDLNTPVSLNRYTYAHNNPIRYADPSGRCVEIWVPACAGNPLAMANAIEVNGTPTDARNLTFPETVEPASVSAHSDAVIYLIGGNESAGQGVVATSSAEELVYLVQLQSSDGAANWTPLTRKALSAGNTGASFTTWSREVSATAQMLEPHEWEDRSQSDGLPLWVSPIIAAAARHQAAQGGRALGNAVAGLNTQRQVLDYIDQYVTDPLRSNDEALRVYEQSAGTRAAFVDDIASLGDDAAALRQGLTALKWLGTAASVYDFGSSVYQNRNNGTNAMVRAGGASVAGTAGAFKGFTVGAGLCGFTGPGALGCGVVGGVAGGLGGKKAFEVLYDEGPPIVQSWWDGFMDFRSIQPDW